MKNRLTLALAAAAVILLSCSVVLAISKQEVIELVQAGLDDETIILLIQRDGTTFNLEPDDVIELRRAGVSNAVLQAMLNGGREEEPEPPPRRKRPPREPDPEPIFDDEPVDDDPIFDEPIFDDEPIDDDPVDEEPLFEDDPVDDDPFEDDPVEDDPAGGGDWETIPIDAEMSAFERTKGSWQADGGDLIATTNRTEGSATFAATTKAEYGDVEVAMDLTYAGPGSFKLRVHYQPRSKVPSCHFVRLKPTRGRTVALVVRVQGGETSATLDGSPIDVLSEGTPTGQGPLQVFLGTRGETRIANWRIRRL